MTKDQALKMALGSMSGRYCNLHKEAIAAIEEVLAQPECNHEEKIPMLACVKCGALCGTPAQPEQEPVAWSYWQSCLNDDGTQTAPWVHRLSKFKPNESIINKDIVPLYTNPPQRKPWARLTDQEKKEIERVAVYVDGAIRLTEAKLREKNT